MDTRTPLVPAPWPRPLMRRMPRRRFGPFGMPTTTDPLTMTRRCGACREWLPLDEFSNDASDPYGKGHRCRPCHAQASRAYRAARKNGHA